MRLTPEQREYHIQRLRAETLETCRRLGCTCQPEPVMKLTPFDIGPVPAWYTEHPDDCPMNRLAR